MIVVWLILAAAALGHVCLVVLAMNASHAWGLSERWTDRLMAAILAFWIGATAVLVWAAGGLAWRLWPLPVLGYVVVCLAVALVGLPLTTLARLRRRLPSGLSERAEQAELAPWEETTRLIGTGRHAWMLRLPGNDSLRLRKVEWHVEIPGLPPSCAGLSLLQVSDLHFSPCFDRSYFDAVADEASRWGSDLVAFTGDLVDHEDTIDWIAPVLSRLRGRAGTFAILGNHDYSFDTARINHELHRAGFSTIDGQWVRFDLAGATVAVGGTSAPWGPSLDLDGHGGADVRIVLSHTPDLFYKVAARGIDLVLAGHNHGGQVRLPIVGPVFMPSRYSRRFDCGFFRSGQTLMYVSQGVAGKHPIRYGCLPEVTRFVLVPPPRRSMATSMIRADRLPHGTSAQHTPGELVH